MIKLCGTARIRSILEYVYRRSKNMKRMKRAILYTLNFIIFMAMLTFVALLDSDNYIPYLIGFLACMAWLTLFGYANGYFYHNDR